MEDLSINNFILGGNDMGYDNLKLEKGMYRQAGMSFTQVLESLDPS